jgi:lipopolysaccharide heptosyltransferase II
VNSAVTAVRRVLIIRIDLLGDIIFSLPVARAIKQVFPAAHITMLTLPYTAPLAASSPDVDTVIAIDTNLIRLPQNLLRLDTYRHLFAALRHLRATRFDLTLSLWGRTASLLAFLSRSRLRIGYASEGYAGMFDRPVKGGRRRRGRPQRRHENDYVLDLVRAALSHQWCDSNRLCLSHEGEGSAVRAQEPLLRVDPAARRRVVRMLATYGVTAHRPLIAFHVGSVNGAFKRWPAPSFVRLAQMLLADGMAIVLVGAASEAKLAAEIEAACRSAVVETNVSSRFLSLVGHTSVLELVALLEHVDVLISGDSGPLHIAAALGTPVVGIYGPTDPLVNGPRANGPAIVLRHDLPCSPCYTLDGPAECPLGDPICMRLVSPEQVYKAVRQLLPSWREDQFLMAQQNALEDAKGSEARDERGATVADKR